MYLFTCKLNINWNRPMCYNTYNSFILKINILKDKHVLANIKTKWAFFFLVDSAVELLHIP